ncbi:hypothetical protein ANN_19432 [Periplaneta americana]|uniref:Uncharacterized protein n=1 Tax=Periplaneta americana TaxID=6978 RepID=A0ABQ8S9W5_PERAM|nr:hypothetical protein ANN_19432 [Periplaneta americana]
MGTLIASKYFHVHRTTLQTLSKKTLVTPADAARTKLGRKPFLEELEKLLVAYLLAMEERFFGRHGFSDCVKEQSVFSYILGLKRHKFGNHAAPHLPEH